MRIERQKSLLATSRKAKGNEKPFRHKAIHPV
jgi:hypothetical protein